MKPQARSYLLCLSNRGYRVSLIVRRGYEQLADDDAAKHEMVRVIDESGEDYLYPVNLFVPIDVPKQGPRGLFS